MPTQEQAHYHSNRTEAEEAHAAEIDELVEDAMDQAISDAKARSGCVTADADDWLDEIDAVLEVNAETFVRDFVQKGGQ